MRILIACEESQTVCKAFRALGHEAYSCDVLPCSGGHPDWHIQGDVLEHLNESWDMMVAHPPCTYLTNAGAVHLYPNKVLNRERYRKGLEAKEFFMKLYYAPILKKVIENPIPSKIYELPPYSQTIQPYQFGHPFSKKTCLWVQGVSLLKETNVVEKRESTKIAGNWFNKGGKDRQMNRSKTFQGIADAMANQWGLLQDNKEV